MKETSDVLWNLNLDEPREFYKGKRGTIVSARRTDKICPHDFGVSLEIPPEEEFRPTHVRLFFDLFLKNLSNSKHAKILFQLFERLYDGEDPEKLANEAAKLNFTMQLDDADVNLFYGQLLMIEQEFNYGPQGCKKGKVQPPREFFMRFIRWIASEDEEIDKIITNAVRNWPPPVKYSKRLV